jgi:hypothetical protein
MKATTRDDDDDETHLYYLHTTRKNVCIDMQYAIKKETGRDREREKKQCQKLSVFFFFVHTYEQYFSRVLKF